MHKSIQSIALAAITGILMISGANAQSTKWTKTVDDRAEEVKTAAARYSGDRNEYIRDKLGLVKSDTGGVLYRRAKGGPTERKNEQLEIDTHVKKTFKNEVIFNTARAPEELLRDVGMANDLRASKVPENYWVLTEKTPKDFQALYGEPAFTVALEEGLCTPDYMDFSAIHFNADRGMDTYVDLDKAGNIVEIHVGTCTYTEGPYTGKSTVRSISPAMQNVNFIDRYYAVERLVLKSSIGRGN